ncbi:MAG: type II secretion system protein, partial [Aquificaceae bacterium]|nr:type II secretion system protein [Aquificaceae bacterium]
MKRGFSLVEILVVIFIALVVGAGVYLAYTQLMREAVTRSLVAKNEMDVNAILYQLRKDILSVGFGIDRSLLVLRDSQGTHNDGVINCN